MKVLRACLALTALFLLGSGCKRRDPSIYEPPVRPSAPPTASAAPPPGPVALPESGMVCTNAYGTDAFVWSADGKTTKLSATTRFRITVNGELAEEIRVPSKGFHGARLKSRTHPELPEVDLPTDLGHTWMAPTGDVLFVNDNPTLDVQVWRRGSWTKLTPPPDLHPASMESVVEHDGAFWFNDGIAIYRESDGGFAKVKSDGVALAVVESGKELAILTATYSTPSKLMLGTLRGDAVSGARSIGELTSSGAGNKRVVSHGDDWAVFVGGIGYGALGTVHASLQGKITSPSHKALAVLAIDGYERIFYQTQEGFFVLSPDGTGKLYPKASAPMFQLDNPRCVPLGKGFEALPGTGDTKKGTLTVKVSGAARAPIAVCPKLPTLARCETSPERIEGTLDATGFWSSEVPIGTYEATVQIDGKWLVADLSTVRGGSWYCRIEEGKPCTIELRK